MVPEDNVGFAFPSKGIHDKILERSHGEFPVHSVKNSTEKFLLK